MLGPGRGGGRPGVGPGRDGGPTRQRGGAGPRGRCRRPPPVGRPSPSSPRSLASAAGRSRGRQGASHPVGLPGRRVDDAAGPRGARGLWPTDQRSIQGPELLGNQGPRDRSGRGGGRAEVGRPNPTGIIAPARAPPGRVPSRTSRARVRHGPAPRPGPPPHIAGGPIPRRARAGMLAIQGRRPQPPDPPPGPRAAVVQRGSFAAW
jgi:hypothetical protein